MLVFLFRFMFSFLLYKIETKSVDSPQFEGLNIGEVTLTIWICLFKAIGSN